MKRPFFAIITFILLLTVSCGRNKGMFILHGTVQDGSDTILVVGLDNRFEDMDTIFCKEGQFTWKFRPDTVTTLILFLPDGRHHAVFAEKDVESFITIPADTGYFKVSGGYCNEAYQSFYLESLKDSTLEQTIARIDSFITRDPFCEATPYIIFDRMVSEYHAPESDIEPLIKLMSGNMQDAPYIVSLKSEFEKEFTNNLYLDNYSIWDSAGFKYQFIDVGGSSNHLLVCVWASWMGQAAIDARDTLQYFYDKFRERYFNVTDISVDVNRDMWKKTIEQDTVTWLSYIDPNGWESGLVKNGRLQTLPAFILFSGVKRITYKSTSIPELEKKLDETLPKRKDDKEKKSTNLSKGKNVKIK